MAKELLVNVARGEETRIALVDEGRLEDIFLEREDAASNVGNIYLGKVTNVEGSIQAAFVDFGYGRNGFLHVQDLHPDYFPKGGRWDKMTERVGKKIGRRDRPPIQDCLRRGDVIVVQIIKEGIGTKGPTLTSYPSIPGRFLVMMPGVQQMGVSKNIEDEKERRRLRKVLDGLEPPKDVGFIIRTAGFGKTKVELERDFKYLVRVWEDIERNQKRAKPPKLLYSEGDLVTRTIRDVWTPDIDRVVVDDVETALQIKQFFKLLMPRTSVEVDLYEGEEPIFHAAGIEREIEMMFSRTVPLEGGGSLVIDATEAVVAIDVNSGKFREHGDAEETAFAIDMLAAEEICRQLRLRDLGGLVIVDFVDLRYARHRQKLFDKLTELFKRDKAKSRHLEMNEFGIICITRQRMRPDYKKTVFMPCPWSGGTGLIKTPDSLSLEVLRKVRVALSDDRVEQVRVFLHSSATLQVLNNRRVNLARLERQTGKLIEIQSDDTLTADGMRFELLDDREGKIEIADLRPLEFEIDTGSKPRRRRRRGKKDKHESSDTGPELNEDGLIDLDSLTRLAELTLEEIEDLADQAAAERRDEDRDSQSVIIDALRDRPDARDDDVDDEEDEDEDDQPRRGRRRRRRGGKSRDAEDAQAAEEADRHEADPEDDDEPRGRRRRRRRGGKSSTDTDERSSDRDEPAASDEDEQEEDESQGRRRRRRRRRGGRGSDESVEETVDAAEDNADEDSDEAEEVSRDDGADESEETSRGGRRRRRRSRRGKSDSDDTEAAESTDDEAAAEPETSNDDDAEDDGDSKPTGRRRGRRSRRGMSRSDDTEPSESSEDDEVAAEPEETEDRASDDEESKPTGRRRGRRRRRSSRSDKNDSPAEELEDASEDDADEGVADEVVADDTPDEGEDIETGGNPEADGEVESELFDEEEDDDDDDVAELRKRPRRGRRRGGRGSRGLDEPEKAPEPEEAPAETSEVAAESEADDDDDDSAEPKRRLRRNRRRRSSKSESPTEPATETAAEPAVALVPEATAEPAPEPTTDESALTDDDLDDASDDDAEDSTEAAEESAGKAPVKKSTRKKTAKKAAKKTPSRKKVVKKTAKKTAKKVAKKAPKRTTKKAKKAAD